MEPGAACVLATGHGYSFSVGLEFLRKKVGGDVRASLQLATLRRVTTSHVFSFKLCARRIDDESLRLSAFMF